MADGPVRLGILAPAPVHYYVPLFRALAADPRLDPTVLYASSAGVRAYDDEYGQEVIWDTGLLEGYRSRFLARAEQNPIGGGFLALRDWDVAGLVARARFEVLWLFGYKFVTHMLALAVQRARGGQVLFREEQTLLHPRRLRTAVAKEALLPPLFRQGVPLYIGTENRRWYEHYGVPRSRLVWSPYHVDNERFTRAAERLRPDRKRLREEIGIPDEAGPVICSVGRLVPKKQPLFLLEAFRRVRERMPCVLLLVGSGPEQERLARVVREQSIPDVVLAGFRDQAALPEAYASADVFALLSREHETFGLAVSEAMNFSLPVVVSDKVGCAADLVSPGWNGFVVSPDDPGEAAEALARLVGDERLRAAMGERSRERIAGWSVDVAAAGVSSAVEQVVGPARWASTPAR